MRLTRLVPIATFALSLSVAVPSSAQTDEEKAAARSLATQGAAALQEKKFAEALDLVTRAEAVIHAPPHLLLIGRAQVGLGRLVAARESFLKLIREQLPANAPDAFKTAQTLAKQDLEAIEPRIASLQIALTVNGGGSPSKVTLKMDDQQVPNALIGVHRPVDPGKHTIAAFVVGRGPVTQEVTLGDGEKKEIELTIEPPSVSLIDEEKKFDKPPPPPPPPPPGMSTLRIVGIAGMGAGVAGLAVGGVFLARGSSTQDEADTLFKCKPNCTQDEVNRITTLDKSAITQRNVGIVGLAAGGVFLAGGITLFILGGKKPAPKAASGFIVPYVVPNGGGLVGSF